MPRVCTVCSHESRNAIEDAFLAGQPKTRIAASYGIKEQAVRYHMKEHLPALLAMARDAEREARADTLLDRVEALQRRTELALDKAEKDGEFADIFRGIAEMRKNLELIGEVTKELNRTPTLNLHLNPQYLEVRALIVQALEPYPDARHAVVRALEGSTPMVETNGH